MKAALQFVISCVVAMLALALVCRVALWAGPHLYWFEPAILFIRNVGLVLIGCMGFIAFAAAAIRSVIGEGGK